MNILNNKNKRTSIFKALALCLFAAVSFTFVSCDDDMDIQQSYPFTVETMPAISLTDNSKQKPVSTSTAS